jgi:hypothetical protein
LPLRVHLAGKVLAIHVVTGVKRVVGAPYNGFEGFLPGGDHSWEVVGLWGEMVHDDEGAERGLRTRMRRGFAVLIAWVGVGARI